MKGRSASRAEADNSRLQPLAMHLCRGGDFGRPGHPGRPQSLTARKQLPSVVTSSTSEFVATYRQSAAQPHEGGKLNVVAAGVIRQPQPGLKPPPSAAGQCAGFTVRVAARLGLSAIPLSPSPPRMSRLSPFWRESSSSGERSGESSMRNAGAPSCCIRREPWLGYGQL